MPDYAAYTGAKVNIGNQLYRRPKSWFNRRNMLE